MGKILAVPEHLYKRIKEAPPGTPVTGFVHSHVKIMGRGEIVAKGQKPIKCALRLAESPSERRKTTDRSLAVIFTK